MISMLITCYNCSGTVYISAFYAFCSLLGNSLFFWLSESHHLLPLKFHFFFFFCLTLLFKMAKQNPSPTSTSNSTQTSSSTSTPPSIPNPPPSTSDYKSLYHWAPDALLKETSSFTSLTSIVVYRKKQTCHKSQVFGKDHDKYVRMVPCRIGEPVCLDESLDPEGPFCFIYSMVFRRLGLQIPFTPFERALLTGVNVALAQLHPNNWAFVRAFVILCHCLGHTPSVDVFL